MRNSIGVEDGRVMRKNNLILILYVDIKEMTKNITTLILKQNYPILENLIERISEDYNLNVEDLKKNYLGELKEYKKKRSRAKGVLNAYSVFLADKEVDKKIREENKDLSFGEISKIKGKMWNQLPKEEKDKYKKQAAEKNKSCAKDEEKSEEKKDE